ncbi:globin family protein [Flammeovirgaceae bacterium SG7u.111]|nr:globin family protein [Flammeovirgaceae bacterium SG7u.132]WPO33418.1 globin family protein [Flammeovirgaceae bacterium SG7u.111]
MTESQIQLVKESWGKVVPIATQAGEMFYGRLFEAAPQVKPMFSSDTKAQAIKLTSMLTYVVNKLDKLDEILSEVQQLAVRHTKYGIEPAHYAVVGECLIWTLEQGLGDAWNDELKKAWVTAYTILSGAMIEAQNKAA